MLLVLQLPVGGVVEVGEERVRKKVVVHTVKVNAQHLQDYFLLFQILEFGFLAHSILIPFQD